jgi:hypothetical protein
MALRMRFLYLAVVSSLRGCGVAPGSFDGPDGDARYKLGSFDEEHGNDARRHGWRETIWQRRCGLRELDAAASPSCRRHGENRTSLWQRSPDALASAGSYYRPAIRNSVDAAMAQPAEGPYKGSESAARLRLTKGQISMRIYRSAGIRLSHLAVVVTLVEFVSRNRRVVLRQAGLSKRF